ncbi:MAG: AarF/UbiB family protein [Alkalibacterium sp.]|nr:AarF/UbiB family protein [Alkalibacterium sp.]
MFRDGYFHGDPHPGNIILSNKKIVFIDFGIMGELTEAVKKDLIKMMRAIVFEDIDQLMNPAPSNGHHERESRSFCIFPEDLDDFYQSYVSKSFGQIDRAHSFRTCCT